MYSNIYETSLYHRSALRDGLKGLCLLYSCTEWCENKLENVFVGDFYLGPFYVEIALPFLPIESYEG